MKNKIASPPCGLKALIPAALLALSVSGAQAALSFADSATDAGSSYGSTESIFGAALTASLNGASNTFFLEDLAPGLSWSNIKLTVYDFTSESTAQAPPATASINGSTPIFGSFAAGGTLPPGLAGLSALFNVYTFSFANLSLGELTNNVVTLTGFASPSALLNGFTGLDRGGAVLTATAVPEPSTYALLFAGLAAVGWVARRRAPGRA